jgi:hypothetical protein
VSSTVIVAAAGVVCTALLASASLGSARLEPTVQQVAALRTARAAHTATALRSGQVLVVGGMAEGGRSLGSVELFDPAREVILPLPGLSERRASHTATLLSDRRVLIAGGYNGAYLSSLEMFDPSTRRFSRAGSLAEGRSGHTATLLSDGRVLIAGGVGRGWTFLATAELYDPTTGRSERLAPMSLSREGHTATLLADGRVLIVGGHSGRRPSVRVHPSAEIFAPATRRFERAGSLATARHKHDAIALPDGRVLVIGGADHTDRTHYATTELYDPQARRFEPGPSMRYRRYKIASTAVLLPDGTVLVPAGAEAAEVLDPAGRAFREVPGHFPAAYRFAATAPLPGGDVLIAGGYSDTNENTAGVWRYRQR